MDNTESYDGVSRETILQHHEEYNKNLIDIINNVSKLELGNCSSYNGRIDFISELEMTSNVMGGYDKFKRPFLVFKGTVMFDDDTQETFFQTFFQKYSDPDNILWEGSNGLFPYEGCLNMYQKKALIKLYTDKHFNLTNTDKDVLKLMTVKSIFIQ